MLPILLVALGCAAGTPSDLLITIETSGPGREEKPSAEKKDRLTWPQWRGPSRDARCAGPTWPAAVDAKSLKRLWKVKLGPSYSGPIVSPDIVYTTESENNENEVVRAYDRDSGKELWRSLEDTDPGYAPPVIYKAGGVRQLIAWTPTKLAALDPETGKEYWRQEFKVNFGLTIPTPIYDPESKRLLVSSFYNGSMMMTLDAAKP